MQQTKKREWYVLVLAATLAVVAMNTYLCTRALKTLFESEHWQAHTLEVISQTESLVARMRTAESAARGYILTSDPSFLTQYNVAVQGIPAQISHIRELTTDNISQQDRIGLLRRRMAAKMSALDAGIAVRQGHPAGMIDPTLLAPVIQDTPDKAISVQAVIGAIEGEEHRLLNQRESETARARRQVWFSFIGASILDVVLIGCAFYFLMRIDRDRRQLAVSSAEIETLNSELRSVNAELETRVEQRTQELAASNQELEAFSYSVSHDLRAPLRTIDGFSLALQEDFADKLSDEGRDYINRVRGGVQRMGTLIDSLLQLSRVTRSEITSDRVDLSQLATLVFNELKAGDPERDVSFVAEPDVIVQGDGRLLRIALENLIGNAFKFTSKTPAARIEFGSEPGTGPNEGRTVYFIRDNGAGFDMQYVNRLFTAFQRLHGDRDFKGSGIGLATVSRIIRRHQGSIRAVGEIGRGATFYFTLGV